MRAILGFALALLALGLLLGLAAFQFRAGPRFSGWGINPGSFAPEYKKEGASFFAALRSSDVIFLREGVPLGESPFVRPPGRRILGLIPYSFGLSPDQAADLRVVYAAAQRLGNRHDKTVDVWENYNEPDLAFDPDAPDHSTAFMKAVYLGLKDSAAGKAPVLLPGLGLPPGPWLDRAERNGLLAYGDAFNFHYYSGTEGFAGAIGVVQDAQRQAVAEGRLPRPLPIWVTEIGLACTPLNRPADEAARQRQADFFRDTARTASAMGLAGFFPFAYRDSQEGFSLANARQQPYPAWSAYANATRSLPLNAGPKWIDQMSDAPRVILQWLPDASTCRAHKVSGTYRFLDRTKPITGRVRIYSFADKPVSGVLHLDGGSNAAWSAPAGFQSAASDPKSDSWKLDLKPGEVREVRVNLAAPPKGYAAGWIEGRFDEASPSPPSPSLLHFGWETAPHPDDFADLPCVLAAPAPTATGPAFHSIDDPRLSAVTSENGPWLGLNGLTVRPATEDILDNPAWTFQLDDPSMNPGAPPMAVARISHLPAAGFLHVSSNRPLGRDVSLRVDLVDADGQRFTIFENNGLDPGLVTNRLWLNLADFHRYFWGAFIPGENFDPKNVRELQVRFYFKFLHDPVQIGFETMRPRLLPK